MAYRHTTHPSVHKGAPLERRSHARARRGEMQQTILELVFLTGIIGVAVLAPNALQMFRGLTKTQQAQKRQAIQNAITRLHRNGLLEFRRTTRGQVVRITDKGRRELIMRGSRAVLGEQPQHWDGKWRLIVFDIGEHRKRTRELLRRALSNIGFVQLQKSVWVYPYPCEELIALLKADFKIGKDVLYVIADEVENDQRLMRRFGVKRK